MTEVEERDHVKDQLCARIEELEKEKLELNEQLDVAQQERAALAAHVERMSKAALDAIHYLPGGEIKAELRDAYDDTPETSLARLKAQWLKGIKQQSRRARNYSAPDQVFLAIPLTAIHCELLQQAEGGEV